MTSPSALRVQAALRERGIPSDVVELAASTRTAQEAAAALGCQVAQIVKSLVFRASPSDRAVLVLASGANRVDEAAVGRLLGETIGRADPAFVRDRTGFAIGGVAPTGHLESLPTFLDEDLFQFDDLWAAAGTPHAVFHITPAQLAELTGGTIAAIAPR